ncbi:MAG: CoA pyrophosphatase [Chloroflexi bacterium]|nr:CoA pyrophosphatase [Chloroflexota bacterium]
MQERLKQILAQRQKRGIIDASRWPAAVLLPLFYQKDELHLLFTKRTDTVKNHKGQISFPGGAYQSGDETLAATALRECTEEIGLRADGIEILGELDDIITRGSNYVISPFVALVPWPCQLRPDPFEVEEIFAVPLSALLDDSCCESQTEIIEGKAVPSCAYHYQGRVIWGATARILSQFLTLVREANAQVTEVR